MTTPEIFVYKMTADNGGAPCVWRGLLSLAICKPKIRKSAQEGSLIFGFGGKDYGERLIYIAKVTQKPAVGVYYRSAKFAKRPDCIYEDGSRGPRLRPDARYHTQSDERRKDVGMRFSIAHVLLSRDFRYFGKSGTDDYKKKFPAIKALIERLMQGERRNHPPGLRSQLLELKTQVWRKHRKVKIGCPTDSDTSRLCNRDTGSIQC